MHRIFYVALILLVVGVSSWWAYGHRAAISLLIRDLRPPLSQTNVKDPVFESTYTMEVVGTYANFDENTYIMTLQGKDGSQYNFEVPTALVINGDIAVTRLDTTAKIRVRWDEDRSKDQLQADHDVDPGIVMNAGKTAISFERLN